MQEYCMYLRKSRADIDAEAGGVVDILARHEQILTELAERRGLNVTAIYREIASGESIARRPVMQQLLHEIEQGKWAGVLVTETSRLARGNSVDQGIVSQTFKYTGTKIITPTKDIDPSDEADEEFFELGLFLSRFEYRMIRRRMVAGEKAARKEGRFVKNSAPYGYEREKLARGWTLRPVPEQAEVVRLIFKLYLEGNGYVRIANRLNGMSIPAPNGDKWVSSSIPGMLRNPHYAGYTSSAYRPSQSTYKDGKLVRSRPKNHELELYEGKHEAIVSREAWHDVQNRMKKTIMPRGREMKNPLASLIVCDKCGKVMVRRRAGRNNIIILACPTPGCPTVSSVLERVEHLLIDTLSVFLRAVMMELDTAPPDLTAQRHALSIAQEKLARANARMQRAFELVEDGTYSRQTFLMRQSEIQQEQAKQWERIEQVTNKIESAQKLYEARSKFEPRMRQLMSVYDFNAPAADRNRLLRSVIASVDYHKTIGGRWATETDLRLTIHPIIFLSDHIK